MNDMERRQLEVEIDECIESIDNNLFVFETIVDSVIVDKEIPKALGTLRKIIFEHIESNDKIEICADIFDTDAIVNEVYSDFSNMLASYTYSNISGMDKMDNKYFLELINNAIYLVKSLINNSEINDDSINREMVRMDYLKRELNMLTMKLKMTGKVSFDISMDKVNELINNVTNRYYQLHFTVLEPLFVESIMDIDNVSYDKYDLEMKKLSLYTSVRNIEDNMYAFLEEEGEDKLKEIKDIIKNVSEMDNLESIKIILKYLEGIQFIRYEYPSVEIWKRMILELLSMVVDLMNRLSKDNNKEELEKLKELYLKLKKKYYGMIFIGSSKDIIDIEKTERENLTLVRR